jgi:anti-anti-sigma factor
VEILEQRQGAVTVVKPMGPLTGPDAEEFQLRLAGVMERSLGRFVIDATEVAYVDSRGLEVLKEACDELAGSGRAVRLCGAGETLREVLDLTDLSRLFEHYADVQSAVRSFL